MFLDLLQSKNRKHRQSITRSYAEQLTNEHSCFREETKKKKNMVKHYGKKATSKKSDTINNSNNSNNNGIHELALSLNRQNFNGFC